MEVYGASQEKCAVRLFPMSSMSFYGGLDKEYQLDAQQVLALITNHLSMPEYIVGMAKEFIDSFAASNHTSAAAAKSPKNAIGPKTVQVPINLSIHWRFNPKEFNLDNIERKIGDVLEGLHADTAKYMFGKPDALANSFLRHVHNSVSDMEENFLPQMVGRFGSEQQGSDLDAGDRNFHLVAKGGFGFFDLLRIFTVHGTTLLEGRK